MAPRQAALAYLTGLRLSVWNWRDRRLLIATVWRESGRVTGTVGAAHRRDVRYGLNSHAFPAGGEAVLLGQQHVGLFTAGEADDRTQSEQGQNATESLTAHAAKSMALASGACV